MIRKTLPAVQEATFAVCLPNAKHRGMPTPIGTGFFVSPDGIFLTAAHVVSEDNTPTGKPRSDLALGWFQQEGRIREGSPFPFSRMCIGAELLDTLPAHDIAVLKLSFASNAQREWLKGRTTFPHITTSSRVLVEGEPVYSFGYPLSFAEIQEGPIDKGNVVLGSPGVTIGMERLCPRVTSAIVASTISESGPVWTSGDPQCYVLDKALNFGNSGGPVVASDTGCVHAVCSSFQPMPMPQRLARNRDGSGVIIEVPSLYGIASSLAHEQVQGIMRKHGVPITAD